MGDVWVSNRVAPLLRWPRMAVRDALSGRTLGEFVLRERIGEGGFGAVYRCEQPLLGREAVIKVLHTSLRSSEIVLQRFTREAQLASRLDHPYAAHIYAFGVEKDDGLCWIAMELVQGTTLDRWLRERGPLPIAQLVPFFERVAEVVQTAHEGGIVHRDLKPSNIMVIERAGRLLPKLLDFGIAKMVVDKAPKPRTRTGPVIVVAAPVAGDAATALPVDEVVTPPADDVVVEATPAMTPMPAMKPSDVVTLPADLSGARSPSSSGTQLGGSSAQLTKDDAAIGSPPYMSPEQWIDATRVGPSSDLYALGVVAYEALLGRRPFVATSITALAGMHCHEPVPAVGEGFSPAWDRFFQRALAKKPDDRPATALELAATLRVAAGIGSAPEDLPRLDEGIRDAWLAEAPQNLAEGVAELDGARNVHQARDAARDLFRGLVRYLVAVALAARAQIRGEHDDPAVRELLRALRGRELDEDERIKLLRLLVRPFADRRGAYPVPELVDFVGRGGEERDAIEAMLQLRPSTDHGGTEDIVRSQLVQFIPALAKVMRAAAFVLDYPLVIPRERVPERWMGMRRQRRTVAFVKPSDLVDDQALLLDREGRRVLVLWPIVQAISPTVGTERESFVLDGRGRLGARLTAAPAGYEHHDPAVWEWFAEHVLGEVEGEAEKRDDDRPPYLGLASFAASDADRFVGREREIDAFVNRVRRIAAADRRRAERRGQELVRARRCRARTADRMARRHDAARYDAVDRARAAPRRGERVDDRSAAAARNGAGRRGDARLARRGRRRDRHHHRSARGAVHAVSERRRARAVRERARPPRRLGRQPDARDLHRARRLLDARRVARAAARRAVAGAVPDRQSVAR